MEILRQLLAAAVLACLPTATGHEMNFQPLKPYYQHQIELPYGVMPHWDRANPTYGMAEDGNIEWMNVRDFDDLGITYAGRHPDAWPEVLLPVKTVVPRLSRPQAALLRRLQLRAEHRYRGPLWQLEPRFQIVVRPLPVDQRSGLIIEGTRN